MVVYYEVMRTPYGRYLWYPDLSFVDYYPKRARHSEYTANLSEGKNTELGALEASIKHTISTFAI
jgi:hypothetical protein